MRKRHAHACVKLIAQAERLQTYVAALGQTRRRRLNEALADVHSFKRKQAVEANLIALKMRTLLQTAVGLPSDRWICIGGMTAKEKLAEDDVMRLTLGDVHLQTKTPGAERFLRRINMHNVF